MIESAIAFRSSSPSARDHHAAWVRAMGDTSSRMTGQMVKRYDLNDRTAGPIPGFGGLMDQTTKIQAQSYAPLNHTPTPAPVASDDGYEFSDVIDMINPLQHLPVVGMIYRHITGDTLKPISQIIGGTVFGGPVGAVSSTVNVIVENRTGKDITENVLAMADISIDDTPSKKPDLVYGFSPLSDLDGTTLAVANLSVASPAPKNFAAQKPIQQNWNT
jgi:hypothetical protein